MSLLALGFIGERNYRSNLIKFGYDLGSEKTVENILREIERDPCGEIFIFHSDKNFSLTPSQCIKSK